MLKYLSPSALRTYERDREEFYLMYLAPYPLARGFQIQAAAVGSAFDAYVKSHLVTDMLGDDVPDGLSFDALFEGQVRPEHRDWALVAGREAMKQYVASGRYTELLLTLQEASSPPQFQGKVTHQIEGVPVSGFPDCSFHSKSGFLVVLDWKLKGFCSKTSKSPTKHFVNCRDGFSPIEGVRKPSKTNNKPYKKDVPITVDGMLASTTWMEQSSTDYSDQLCIYLWALGETPGTINHLGVIDELVAKPQDGDWPLLRIATLSARISAGYQMSLVSRMKRCWGQLTSGHIFDHLSYDESRAKCEQIDAMSRIQASNVDKEFADFIRSQFRYH